MNKKNKNKKDLSVWGTIAVVFALLSSFSDIMDETAFVMLAVVAVFVIVAVVFVKAIKKANATAERGGNGSNKPADAVPQSTAPKNSVVLHKSFAKTPACFTALTAAGSSAFSFSS